MKAISGMPEHKVKMFDKTSRRSDSVTERIIESQLQNSLGKSDLPGIRLIDEAQEFGLDQNGDVEGQRHNQS